MIIAILPGQSTTRFDAAANAVVTMPVAPRTAYHVYTTGNIYLRLINPGDPATCSNAQDFYLNNYSFVDIDTGGATTLAINSGGGGSVFVTELGQATF